jgi:signal transduction histidine kinase
LGDVLCFTLVTCAAALSSARPAPLSGSASALKSAHAFVPTLAMLLAIGLFGASLASTRAPDAWILVGLVILTALLLVVRQSASSRKLAELNRELAFRVADARLTELVQQSADAYLIIDARGMVVFASPSIQRNTDISAFNALGSRAAALFGAEYDDMLSRYIGRLMNERMPPAPLELSLDSHDKPRRVLKIRGANKLDNVHINGLTLTISDISEQRALEREVLTAANLERVRIAGDIHDGLSQELSGIALMLHGLTKERDLGAAEPRTELQGIIEQILAAIHGARDLARGLSPIYVVRGSLCDALESLNREIDGEPTVKVLVDPPLAGLIIDELPADHLYRIAREAVQIATGYGASQIEIRLRRVDPHLLLEIASDGGANRPAKHDEYGLKLMEYQARIIGATFDIARQQSGGRLIRVAARLWNVARAAAG